MTIERLFRLRRIWFVTAARMICIVTNADLDLTSDQIRSDQLKFGIWPDKIIWCIIWLGWTRGFPSCLYLFYIARYVKHATERKFTSYFYRSLLWPLVTSKVTKQKSCSNFFCRNPDGLSNSTFRSSIPDMVAGAVEGEGVPAPFRSVLRFPVISSYSPYGV